MKPKRIRSKLVRLVIVWFLVLPAYSGDIFSAQRKTRHPQPHAVKVIELHDLEPLKAAFQRDSGKVRLLMILSPT